MTATPAQRCWSGSAHRIIGHQARLCTTFPKLLNEWLDTAVRLFIGFLGGRREAQGSRTAARETAGLHCRTIGRGAYDGFRDPHAGGPFKLAKDTCLEVPLNNSVVFLKLHDRVAPERELGTLGAANGGG